MRIVIQRVSSAAVSIDDKTMSSIGSGLMILLGIVEEDCNEDAAWLCGKISTLRIFNDHEGVMNLSVTDVKGEILVVSQFTLHASTRKGNRPSYIRAARPEKAVPLYETFIQLIAQETGVCVKSGVFGAMMDISMVNTGPVTIIMDSKIKE